MAAAPEISPDQRTAPSTGDPGAAPALGGPVRRLWRRLDRRGLGPFWATLFPVLLAQLVGLCAYSTYLYDRFDLTDDFATYSQAWWLIGHGHLDPLNTIQAPVIPFWQSHFELAMWPVALVGHLFPHPLSLLWLQDLALVAAEALTLWWVADIVRERLGRARNAAALFCLVALLASVWWYETASFDVHFETLGLPFVVLAGHALWGGRTRRLWIAAVLAVLFGDVVAVSLLGVAMAGLLSRRVWQSGRARWALALAVFALAWVAMVTLLNGNQGTGVVSNYGYLVRAGPHATTASVAKALALHPGAASHVLANQWRGIGRVLVAGGILGVLTPWGLLATLVTAVPAALNVNRAFITPDIAFQTLAAIPLLFVGTTMVLVRLGSGPAPPTVAEDDGAVSAPHTRWWQPTAAWVLALALFAATLAQAVPLYSSIRSNWWTVDAPTAAALAAALPSVPAGAEAVVSQGVIGRFASRQEVYPYLASPQAFPVHSATVVFVIVPSEQIGTATTARARADAAYVRTTLRATVLVQRAGVLVARWRPPSGTRTVVLP